MGDLNTRSAIAPPRSTMPYSNHRPFERIVKSVQVVLFILMISTYVILEVISRSGSPILGIQPSASYYSNVKGNLKPYLAATTYQNPADKYHFTIDADGFRTMPPGGKDPYTILCTGDSFTFGVGSDDDKTFPYMTQRELARERPLRLYNAGTIATGIDNHLAYYLDKGRLLNPDLVVEQFFYYALGHNIPYSGYPRRADQHEFNFLKDGTLAPVISSYLLQMFNALPLPKALLQFFHSPGQATGNRSISFFRDVVTITDEAAALLKDSTSLLKEDNIEAMWPIWERYLSALKLYHDTVKEDGKNFILIIIPDNAQLTENFNAPSVVLSEFCERNNIPYLDTTSLLRKFRTEQNVATFLEDDFHTNTEGNIVISRLIASKISSIIGQSGTTFATPNHIHPNNIYTKPIKIELTFGLDGTLSMTPNRFITSYKMDNTDIVVKEQGGGNIRYVTTAPGKTTSRLRIALSTASPVNQARVVFFPHLADGDSINNKFILTLSLGLTQEAFSTGNPASPERFRSPDNIMFLEAGPNNAGSTELALDLSLLRDAGLVMNKVHGPVPRRRLELTLYPAAREGLPAVTIVPDGEDVPGFARKTR